jgi:hypothetical protein
MKKSLINARMKNRHVLPYDGVNLILVKILERLRLITKLNMKRILGETIDYK